MSHEHQKFHKIAATTQKHRGNQYNYQTIDKIDATIKKHRGEHKIIIVFWRYSQVAAISEAPQISPWPDVYKWLWWHVNKAVLPHVYWSRRNAIGHYYIDCSVPRALHNLHMFFFSAPFFLAEGLKCIDSSVLKFWLYTPFQYHLVAFCDTYIISFSPHWGNESSSRQRSCDSFFPQQVPSLFSVARLSPPSPLSSPSPSSVLPSAARRPWYTSRWERYSKTRLSQWSSDFSSAEGRDCRWWRNRTWWIRGRRLRSAPSRKILAAHLGPLSTVLSYPCAKPWTPAATCWRLLSLQENSRWEFPMYL